MAPLDNVPATLADASVMPTLIESNTDALMIMIAEKAAAIVLGRGWAEGRP